MSSKVGNRYGKLVVIARCSQNARKVECVCDCGTQKAVWASNLGRHINSCGCLRGERNRARTRHGHSRKFDQSRTYKIWQGMRARCNNPKTDSYKYYGARGIEICERWESFDVFLADMGAAPVGLSIERIDNDASYDPDNCKWATSSEQRRNQRARTLSPCCRKGRHAYTPENTYIESDGSRRCRACRRVGSGA